MKIKDMAIIAMVGGLMSVSCSSNAASFFLIEDSSMNFRSDSQCIRERSDAKYGMIKSNFQNLSNVDSFEYTSYEGTSYLIITSSERDLSIILECNANKMMVGYATASASVIKKNPESYVEEYLKSKILTPE